MKELKITYNYLKENGYNPYYKDGKLTIDGSFNCSDNELTALQIPSNFTVGGSFDCSNNNLTQLTISNGFTVEGNFECDCNKLTSFTIPSDFVVGGSFYCSNNNLTELIIPNNFVVGYEFDCRHNNLTELTIPDDFVVGSWFDCDNRTIFNQKPKKLQRGYHGTYCYYDNIIRPVSEIKHLGNLTAYISPLGVVLVDEHENSAHGKDIKTAYRDLIFKTTSRDTEQYRNADLDEERDLNYLYAAYRNITGSCQQGTEAFISQYEITDENRPKSIREAIAFTKERNAYRYQIFEDFFK